MKQVFIVNKDLDMGKGKICAQVAHAAVECYKKISNEYKDILKKWELEGQKKVVLKASLKEILKIKEDLDKEKIPNCLIIDAGLTQIPKGSITVLGIGPWYDEEIDKFTKNLKLL